MGSLGKPGENPADELVEDVFASEDVQRAVELAWKYVSNDLDATSPKQEFQDILKDILRYLVEKLSSPSNVLTITDRQDLDQFADSYSRFFCESIVFSEYIDEVLKCKDIWYDRAYLALTNFSYRSILAIVERIDS